MIVRRAGAGDADVIAAVHAGSWRRHYRGAYADAYLDGDLDGDRRAVWRSRFADPAGTATFVAEDDGVVVGFVHVVLDADGRWGSLVDNLHVVTDRRYTGVGTALHGRAVEAVRAGAGRAGLFLWVLEQNVAAQRFYLARGGVHVETVAVGGDPGRLNGAPRKQRIVWERVR